MTGDDNEFRDLSRSTNCGRAPVTCVAVSAWLIKTPSVRSDAEVSIDTVGCNLDICSSASYDLLLITAQSGDQQAFVELCHRYSPMVKKRIISIVRNQEKGDDALQDTLPRSFKHLSAFRRTCKFSSRLTTIGIDTALMMPRKRKIRKEGQTELLKEDGQRGMQWSLWTDPWIPTTCIREIKSSSF
jgi:hypothetical protein